MPRPWVLVEVTGNAATGYSFNACNTGKTPAKIIWMEPFIPGYEVPIGQHLPPTPTYNFGYSEDGRLVNAVWIAPKSIQRIGIFDSFAAFPPHARLFVYSAIKYQNTFDSRIHETRFCYRISGGTIALDGPPGYNECT